MSTVKITSTRSDRGRKSPFTEDPSIGSITKTKVHSSWTGLLFTQTRKDDNLFSPYAETQPVTGTRPNRRQTRESLNIYHNL